MAATVRTTTHAYPQEEITAMELFYDGKKCVVTQTSDTIHWAHQLDAALQTSNPRLEWMLRRNLREDRHPTHAAEVRENLVPLQATLHGRQDQGVPSLSLFPHEDIVARTLEYELDVAYQRLKSIEEGNGDPGRPLYSTGYANCHVDCRVHMAHSFDRTRSITRFDPQGATIYGPRQCPGIATSDSPFPVISTLLSVPFTLLHQVTRLVALLPLTSYQSDLLAMTLDIIHLWSWDPLLDEKECLATPVTATVYPSPKSVVSRTNTTFAGMRSRIGEAREFVIHPGSHPSEQPPLMIADEGDDTDSSPQSQYPPGAGAIVWDSAKPFMGRTMNDALMARGYIDPHVYVKYMDLAGLCITHNTNPYLGVAGHAARGTSYHSAASHQANEYSKNTTRTT